MKERSSHPLEQLPIEEYDKLTQENKEILGKTGMRLFLTASQTIPANIVGQSALIALYCKDIGLTKPLLLSACLLSDDSKIAKIASIADKIHNHVQRGPHPLEHDQVKSIIRTDFGYAHEFIKLSRENLHTITTDMYNEVITHNLTLDEYFYKAMKLHQTKRFEFIKRK